MINGDGCSNACLVEDGWDCTADMCNEICGDGIMVGDEICDDGNLNDNDGCDFSCTVMDTENFLCLFKSSFVDEESMPERVR